MAFRLSKLNKYNDGLYLLARLLVGVMLAVHGLQKFGFFGGPGLQGFADFAGVAVWLAALQGLLELLAGLSVALGLWTKVGAALGVITMLAALVVAHFPKGPNPFTNGGELALVYLAALLMFWVCGARKLSVDNRK